MYSLDASSINLINRQRLGRRARRLREPSSGLRPADLGQGLSRRPSFSFVCYVFSSSAYVFSFMSHFMSFILYV